MRVNYIEDLITILENVRQNMRDKKIKTKFNLREWVKVNECGTTCCAIGYATLDPVFKRRGLRLVGYGLDATSKIKNPGMYQYSYNGHSEDVLIKSSDDIDKMYSKAKKKYKDIFFYIKYKEFENFDAVRNFFKFEVPGTTAMLFSDSRYNSNNKSLRNVIARLKYLAKHGEVKFHSKYAN